MTAKRDLKKRIRDRQAKTGESYTTARRHVLAARDRGDSDTDADDLETTNPGIAKPEVKFEDRTLSAKPELSEAFEVDVDKLGATARHPIDVDEVIDISDTAGELGLKCKVLVYERLSKLVPPKLALIAVRDALEATKNDPATGLLRAVAVGEKSPVRPPRMWRGDPDFMARVTAGLSAVSLDGRILALHVNGFAGMVSVFCAAWRHNQTLVLTTPEDRIGPALARIVPLPREQTLFLIYEGRRYPMTREPFVIGRHPSCQLQIKDGHISRKHAAIVQREGTYYILDLGSHAGIDYRGMRISNKRIDEGDMFTLCDYALRFTFHETDA